MILINKNILFIGIDRKYILLCSILLFINLNLYSQKGVTNNLYHSKDFKYDLHPLLEKNHAIYAVITGISNYQSPKITDLDYSDRDAQKFAEWLSSEYGANVPSENIKLLLNENATLISFGDALQQLQDSIKEGEVAIIYFSGHGDMETKTFSKFGYLLCYDTPPHNYKVGAYAVQFLQDIVSTIASKNAKIIMITDACHSGKLAGNAIGGTQATAEMLAQNFANEIKLMSCQPHETSIEGQQWGGGRGVFSYYLEKALIGLADYNNDNIISLAELNLFLTSKIPEEIFPRSQTPIVEGDQRIFLVAVDSMISAKAKQEEYLLTQNSIKVPATKGFDGSHEVSQDSVFKKLEYHFNRALDSSWLMEPKDYCANDLYLKMEKILIQSSLLTKFRNKLFYALHDEVQQAINSLLETEPVTIFQWSARPSRFELYPAYLKRIIALLGPKHNLYPSLLAKQLYFEAYLKKQFEHNREEDQHKRKIIQNETLGLLLKAFQLDSSAAFITQAIADLYLMNNPAQTDSMLYWTELTIQRSPTWIVPYINLSLEYQSMQSDFKTSNLWLNKALLFDSTSVILLERLAWLKQRENKTDQTIEICNKIIKLYPNIPNGYYTLSGTYAFRREFENMKVNFEKLIEYNFDEFHLEPYYLNDRRSSYYIPIFQKKLERQEVNKWMKFMYAVNLAIAHYTLGNKDEALKYCKLAEAWNAQPWYLTEAKLIEGKLFFEMGNLQKSEEVFFAVKKIDPANPNYPKANAWLAKVEVEKGNFQKADSLFNVAINTWLGSAWDDFVLQEECHYLYGRFLIDQNRYEEARKMFLKSNQLSFQRGYMGWYGLACLEAKQSNIKQALIFFKKALDCYYPRSEPIYQEPLFLKLKKTQEFKVLMNKHFPKN